MTTSLVALIDANNTLDGAVSSVLPLEVRGWGNMLLPSGLRVVQAELVCNVLRNGESTIPQVLAAFKLAIATAGPEITDFVKDSPNLPSIAVYVKSWPYDPTADAQIALWCVAGTVEEQGAQQMLMTLLSDVN